MSPPFNEHLYLGVCEMPQVQLLGYLILSQLKSYKNIVVTSRVYISHFDTTTPYLILLPFQAPNPDNKLY